MAFLFLSATVIDGSEEAVPYTADVFISNGLIARIASGLDAEVPRDIRRIDAAGCVLSPGFIDMHAHSDLYLLTNPNHEPKITQGCTTEVVGQDGISYYPTNNDIQMTSIRAQIAGWNGNPSDEECATLHKDVGMFQWRELKDYLDCLDRNKTATNVAVLVPQGNLRLLAVGPEDSVSTADQTQEQVRLLKEAMSQGAVGMSSGLTYTPGMYASTSELAVLCASLAKSYPGAYYAPHHRSYGLNALESYEEMLNLGRSTGCPVHLTHATMNFDVNRGRADELIKMIDAARDEGVDVSLDTYPYLPGSTTLAALLPSWASSGGPAATLSRLNSPLLVEKMRIAVEVTGCDGGHGLPTDWNCIEIAGISNPEMLSYSGKTIGKIAAEEGRLPSEVFFDILQKDELRTSILMHMGDENNVQLIMQHCTHCSGSDGILHGARTHPRAWGTMPRFLGHYSRDLSLIPLPSMIAHLTSRPAKRLSMYPSRGLVAEGSIADLVLFDPKTIKDEATYSEPKKQSSGIRFVVVNGEVALDEGKPTGVRAGVTLRRREDGKVTGKGL